MHKAGVGGVVGSQDDDEAVVACAPPSCYIMTKEKEEKGKREKEGKGREKREKRGMMDKSEIEG